MAVPVATKTTLWVVWVVLCLLNAGCSPDPVKHDLDDYLYRLSNTLALPIAAAEVAPLMPLPAKRDLHIPAPQQRIDLIDFLRLSHCELQRLVGQRNSSLGRVMSDSQQWLYDREFVRLGQVCLPFVEDVVLKEAVSAALAAKQAYRPALTHNVLWAGPELRAFLSYGQQGINTDVATARLQAAALDQLADLFRQPSPDGQRLETTLALLLAPNGGGQLLRQLRLAEAYLTPATQALLQAAPLCPQGKLTRRGEILGNVFRVIYVDRIQPLLSGLDQQLSQLQPALAQHRHWIASPVLDRYWQAHWALDGSQAASTAAGFRQALLAHTKAWQVRLGECGLRPGA